MRTQANGRCKFLDRQTPRGDNPEREPRVTLRCAAALKTTQAKLPH